MLNMYPVLGWTVREPSLPVTNKDTHTQLYTLVEKYRVLPILLEQNIIGNVLPIVLCLKFRFSNNDTFGLAETNLAKNTNSRSAKFFLSWKLGLL